MKPYLKSNLHIELIKDTDNVPFDLLELADPSRNKIELYLKTGKCYIAKEDAIIVGVLVLEKIDKTTIEIKNIAVRLSKQGNGIGKALLNYAEKIGRLLGLQKLQIATGNSSLVQLALYQKVGFKINHIEENFFLKNYSEPIFENGIQCKHKVILIKNINSVA